MTGPLAQLQNIQIPYFDTAISIGKSSGTLGACESLQSFAAVAIATIVNNVKVYRVSVSHFGILALCSRDLQRNCEELSRQCVDLILAMSENTEGLEGTLTQQAIDQVTVCVQSIVSPCILIDVR
jgi:hypothetical protein